MEVIPAVDVLAGRAVRLREGRREEISLEGGDPVELARRFAAEGASRLHVVDLDGAFSGSPSRGLLERLVAVGLPVQVGGGYRTVDAVAAALDSGADRVMIGTGAVSPTFLNDVLGCAGERLVVAIDARDGRVVVEGWTGTSELEPVELARRCASAGVTRLLVTSTRRDGSLAGPDVELLAGVLAERIPVLAAGGIGSVDDLRAIGDLGCEGAVVGSALLAGRFTLSDAIEALARV
jgi:phosphoribosylformimino-5-aminoimidazole carboxamide ribotide isomerase